MTGIALKAAELLEKQGVSCDVINPRTLRPADDELILSSAKKTGKVFVIGDVIKNGGFGSYVTELINNTGTGAPVTVLGLPDKGIEHGKENYI